MDAALDEQTCCLNGVSSFHLDTEFVDQILEVGCARTDTFYTIEPAVIRPRGSNVVCPQTQKLGSSYVDALSGPEHVGNSDYMLSYSWGYQVGDVVSALSHHCQKENHDPKSTYFWICCLCINQHRVIEVREQGDEIPFEEFRAAFRSRVRGIGKVLALMAPWDRPVYVTRAWCVFELFTAISDESCRLTVVMPPSEVVKFCGSIANTGALTSYLWSALEQLDLETAQASVASDKDMILQIVRDGVGLESLNQVVRQRLLSWLAEAAYAECCDQLAKGGLRGDSAATAVSETANLLHRLGKFDDACTLLSASIDTAFTPSEEGTIEKANLWRVVWKNYDYLGQNEAAAEAFQKALGILRQLNQLESHDGAAVLTCVAANLQEMGRMEEALANYEQAWEIRQVCGSERSLDASDLLAMMGVAECKLGSSAGLQHAQQAKTLRIQLGQLNSPHGAHVLQQLGLCHFMLGDIQAAIVEFDESKAILEKTSSLQTPQGASVLQRAARCFCKLGDAQRELELLWEARKLLEDAEQLHSKSGVLVLLDLGSALLDAREDAEAKKVLELAEQICSEKGIDGSLSELVQERLKVLRKTRYCIIS
ncbi:unnamed protein product [Symbiodinium necroappetens]|uniref:Uncharacterized protein n=1 Tax=Symbiodinium necroappetens TaxID=1628268 RepID=A0A812NKZ6_9DINO|nr:unnamed protein product [Symbiodinium necroappetens]